MKPTIINHQQFFGPEILLLSPTFLVHFSGPYLSQQVRVLYSTFSELLSHVFSTVKVWQASKRLQRSWHSMTLDTRLGLYPAISPPL